jgi:class 3 adenylate cyclase
MAAIRRLAAILAADVVGYSRLMRADEEGTHQRCMAHRRELVDPKISQHHGRVVKYTGDGMLVEFPSVVEAVLCAVEVQSGMSYRNLEVADDERISFRMGINLGDVIAEPEDIYGDGVNIAARLEALAEPNGIRISQTAFEQVRDKLPYPFEDLGQLSVKNIARPLRAFALRPETIMRFVQESAGDVARRRQGSALGRKQTLGRADDESDNTLAAHHAQFMDESLLPDENTNLRSEILEFIGEDWLDTRNVNLQGRTPAEVIGTPNEFQVRLLLRSIKSGDFS